MSPAPLPVRSSDPAGLSQESFDVIAAGALCWRLRDGALQVMLIHRPKYDDLSFPKGKLDEGESVAECAVREVREEVGLQVTLGLPLPAVTYDVARGHKVVFYWAAHVISEPRPDGNEVDAIRWVSAKEAEGLLSNRADVAPLKALREAHKAGRLRTVPFVLARHAKAKPRAGWTRAEGERPLATSGKRQAKALAVMLDAWMPQRVASSPWTRCRQTMAPYAHQQGLPIKTVNALTEHAARRHPQKAAKVFLRLMEKARSTVVCTHRPVLPVLLDVLSARLTNGARGSVPERDPYLRPAAIIVAQRSVDAPTKLLSCEVHEPFDD